MLLTSKQEKPSISTVVVKIDKLSTSSACVVEHVAITPPSIKVPTLKIY